MEKAEKFIDNKSFFIGVLVGVSIMLVGFLLLAKKVPNSEVLPTT